jgi:tetratricopeptide (TPR) repeat protein
MRVAAIAFVALLIPMAFSSIGFAEKGADAYYKEGLAFKQQGKTAEAITALEAAVAANPKHGQAWASLGSLYKLNKDLPKSIDAYEHATALITKNKDIWENLGTAYANSNPPRLDDAIRALSEACKLDPKDGSIRSKLGTVKRKKGDNAGAIADLEMAVSLKADEPEWQHNLGVAYRFANREDDAIKAFTKAIALDPNNATFHFDLAVAYRRHKDKDKKSDPQIDQAIAEYEKATSLEPGNAEGWFDLGFMYKENHENDKAIAAFNKYLELNKGKDSGGQKRVADEVQSMGGTPTANDKDKKPKGGGTPKKPAPKNGK